METTPFRKRDVFFTKLQIESCVKIRPQNSLIIALTVGTINTFSGTYPPAEFETPEDNHPDYPQ